MTDFQQSCSSDQHTFYFVLAFKYVHVALISPDIYSLI